MQIRPEDIVQAGSLDLLAKKAVEGFITGFHKSPFQGYSVEFAENRPYNVGENTKNIDWKLFARSDKLYNKYFDEETNLRCYFLIDVSSSMQINHDSLLNKLQYSILLSASFMEILKKQRDASSLCFFDEGIKEYSKVSSSSRHYREMLHKMESYLNFSSYKKSTDVSDAIHQIANQIHRRGLVILFTDFFEKDQSLERLFDAIRHLKHRKHEVIVFHVLHYDSELNFNLGNSPLRVEDSESGEIIKLLPQEVKSAYQKRIAGYNEKLLSEFNQNKIDYVPVDTSKSVEEIILPFLMKRKKMR
tara:strand:+ start:59 stop:967 length:909 start_codon:yes stop_codon:yes gene_type:complete